MMPYVSLGIYVPLDLNEFISFVIYGKEEKYNERWISVINNNYVLLEVHDYINDTDWNLSYKLTRKKES